MEDLHRMVGILEGFKDAQVEANRVNRIEHQKMMDKISEINQWRWKLEGIKIILSSMCGMFGGALATALFKKWLTP